MSIGFALVLVISAGFYLRALHRRPPAQTAYAANSHVTLWDTTAQVREPVATIDFGERLTVLDHFEDQAQVRTAKGDTGWISADDLLSDALWQQMTSLDATADGLPIEARGHTRVLSNLHIAPGRTFPRICQLGKEIPVDLLERRAIEVPAAPAVAAASSGEIGETPASEPEPAEARKEDWWLVRAHVADHTPLAGWVLGRFVDLDVPPPLPNYMAAAGMRIVAWFELNRVAGAQGQTVPQYLVVGVRGPEGQPCDFTLVRVFTWSQKRQRYETAFVESDVCGQLPVHLMPAAAPGGDAAFSFADASNGAPVDRAYRMHQTVVRREREAGPALASAH
ncbi:MAG: SH3 domain-containing protein [Candidatus Acidiferrales bacterium]